GQLIPGQRVLLVEDLATDGKSKVNFINALRDAGGKCDHCFVIFFYDIYPQGKKILGDLGVTLHALTTWKDVLAVAKASGEFEPKLLAEVEKFIHDPAGWSQAHGGAAEAAEKESGSACVLFAAKESMPVTLRCERQRPSKGDGPCLPSF